ncbi:hypothetical protein [Nonomuraea sp. NPDC050786]|uniref:hypothetical protein n=1 Tax=Nonomuraea sp. NPDC050786 TaxID=3154840 RepID=UPI003402C613
MPGVPQDHTRLHFPVREVWASGTCRAYATMRRCAAPWSGRAAGSTPVVAALPDGLDTRLGKAFGGVEPSPGRWERLARARALMRPDPLLLMLDEPTGARDPKAEYKLFRGFARQVQTVTARGGIALLVSHRLSTVRLADLI